MKNYTKQITAFAVLSLFAYSANAQTAYDDSQDAVIADETTRATAAEGVNATAIADETNRATTAEGAIRSDLRTSWTDSSNAVSAVTAANLTAVEDQITNLTTYIDNEGLYQDTLTTANGANDTQIGLDGDSLTTATTSAASATTALSDANNALTSAQLALDGIADVTSPEFAAAELARNDAQTAATAAGTLNTNAQTLLTQAQNSVTASANRKTAIEGAITRSEVRVDEAEAAQVTIQTAIDTKNTSFDTINNAIADYGQGIFDGAGAVNDLDSIIATLDAVVGDDDAIDDVVDPADLPTADDGADLTTAYLNNLGNDPISVAAYVAEADAALLSITAPMTSAEQETLLDTIGNGAFERQAITEIATNGIDGIITQEVDGSIHIGENSLITNEVGGVQELYAEDAGNLAIDINVTNGSNLLINGVAVATETFATSADTAQSTALTTAFTAADANLQSQINNNSSRIESNQENIEQNTRGIAMVAALQHTTVLPGMTNAFDLSAAHFEGETGLALNFARRINENVQINFGAASTTDFDESVIKAGIGVQW